MCILAAFRNIIRIQDQNFFRVAPQIIPGKVTSNKVIRVYFIFFFIILVPAYTPKLRYKKTKETLRSLAVIRTYNGSTFP
jgi:hypothetical protein